MTERQRQHSSTYTAKEPYTCVEDEDEDLDAHEPRSLDQLLQRRVAIRGLMRREQPILTKVAVLLQRAHDPPVLLFLAPDARALGAGHYDVLDPLVTVLADCFGLQALAPTFDKLVLLPGGRGQAVVPW